MNYELRITNGVGSCLKSLNKAAVIAGLTRNLLIINIVFKEIPRQAQNDELMRQPPPVIRFVKINS